MTSLRHRALSVLCAATLATSMMPTSAFAETLTGGGALNGVPDIAPVTVEADVETSARELQELIQPFSLSSVGPVPLKASNEVRWIDRLDLSGYETVMKFYEALVMASDGDGDRDYLIKESYSVGSAASTGTGIEVGNYNNEKKCIIAYVGSYTKEKPFNECFAQALPYVYAVYAAFDRDHPEVFWLSGTCKVVGWGESGRLYVGYSIGDTSFSGLYSSEASILQGIKARDANLDTIISSVPQKAAPSVKVKNLNYWLTHHNAYNNSNLEALKITYPDAWECVSALAGQVGAKGPVCEAYARAFKVLCDEEGIPCVLVDGYAKDSSADAGEAHMWNYVQVEDGKWYAVDVTWNDPGKAATPISQNENESWLLVGASTVVDGMQFQDSHPATNKVHEDDALDDGTKISHPSFTNGPALYGEAYEAHDCQKKGHIDSPELNENVKAATCVRAGSFDRVSYCAACGQELSRSKGIVPALGHSYGAYVYNGDAKVGVDGTETATCSRCGAQDTRTKAGSALKAGETDPGASQPAVPSAPTTKPTSPSTPTTKPSTSAGSSAAAGSALTPAKGQTVTVGGASYTVTGAAAVTYAGPSSKKAASVTVPATVAISGRTYKVTAIASKAFAGNKYLKSVKIGANVTAVPASAFKGCTKLTSVSFGNGITSLGKNAFYGCKALKSVTLGTKIATIGDGAFQNCTKLTKVTVKSTKLSKVGKSTFAGCKKLKSVSLKTTKLKSVGKNALKGTAKKLVVKVPKSKVRAYQKLFKSKGSKTVVVKK